MSLSQERIAYLLEVYTAKKATAAEEQELMDWVHEAQDDAGLKAYIENLWNQQPDAIAGNVNWDNMFNRIVHGDNVYSIAPPAAVKKIRWHRIAAAAAILLLFGSAIFWLLPSENNKVAVAQKETQRPARDVAAPATNKATLTLANGKVIILDNTATGSLDAQGVANARKLNNGELAYAANTTTPVEFHTLQVPKGSQPMQLQLSDGSEVWLNAASSITFPTMFTGSERKVTITGEAYFEVTHDASNPFVVSKGDMQVQVLGTKFNINAYDNDADIRVTLLDGSVKVRSSDKESLLKPGQQARIANRQINVQRQVNIDAVMAWKNGLFEFNETDIQTIMRQIERWYDVEVVFDGAVEQHFNGTIQRQVNVSKVLSILEKTGGIRFTIEGKKVTVKKFL